MELDFVIRVMAALLFGTAIGAERQWRHKIADLRTNALVAVGACLFVSLSVLITNDDSPTRVAAQIVSGIGFLGAGVILREGFNVRGINTAATLWCAAAIGALSGYGFFFYAGVGTAVILTANILLRSFQQKINREHIKSQDIDLPHRLELICRGDDEGSIRDSLIAMLDSGPMALTSLASEEMGESNKVQIQAEILVPKEKQTLLEEIARELGSREGVRSVRWQIETD